MVESIETLKGLGQIAGIGGAALGVLALVFRDAIRKNIFAALTKAQSFALMRLACNSHGLVSSAAGASHLVIQRNML